MEHSYVWKPWVADALILALWAALLVYPIAAGFFCRYLRRSDDRRRKRVYLFLVAAGLLAISVAKRSQSQIPFAIILYLVGWPLIMGPAYLGSKPWRIVSGVIAIPVGYGLLVGLLLVALVGNPDQLDQVIQLGHGYSCRAYSERFYRNPADFVYLVHDELWGLRSRVLLQRTFGKWQHHGPMACWWTDSGHSTASVWVDGEVWAFRR